MCCSHQTTAAFLSLVSKFLSVLVHVDVFKVQEKKHKARLHGKKNFQSQFGFSRPRHSHKEWTVPYGSFKYAHPPRTHSGHLSSSRFWGWAFDRKPLPGGGAIANSFTNGFPLKKPKREDLSILCTCWVRLSSDTFPIWLRSWVSFGLNSTLKRERGLLLLYERSGLFRGDSPAYSFNHVLRRGVLFPIVKRGKSPRRRWSCTRST